MGIFFPIVFRPNTVFVGLPFPKGHLKGNLQKHTRKLEDKRHANKPADLIERALGALQAVDCEQDSFTSDPHIKEMIKEINKLTWEMKKILDRS